MDSKNCSLEHSFLLKVHSRVVVKTLHGSARFRFVLSPSRVAFLSGWIQVHCPHSTALENEREKSSSADAACRRVRKSPARCFAVSFADLCQCCHVIPTNRVLGHFACRRRAARCVERASYAVQRRLPSAIAFLRLCCLSYKKKAEQLSAFASFIVGSFLL